MNKKIFNSLAVATTLAGVIATAGTASAASLTKTATFTASTGDFQFTDFDQTLSIKKFDSSLGKLQKVTLDFLGEIKGDGKFENRSASSASITVNLGGFLSLDQTQLGVPPLLPVTPKTVITYNVAKFDGKTDYAGPSGRTFTGLSASQAGSRVFTDLASLNVFTGTGNLDFLFTALADSIVSGSGNMSYELNTLARGSVAVTYEYKTTPEPSVVIGMGVFAGLGMLSNRKKQLLKWAKS
ncbi:choice-of-anchor E domain-containing protein [Nostoc sp. MS1]|uniref:choice-of-anchor E domain-containing protein n=1 Tax=Nostoc sp. MS1 TaxID=2764711 RepID=UPI001CC4E4E4|nr:choice-of-anchor E domain-containing protein [Nostoc sp. MS1]BCL38948.1 hypothetical protein NSMS1_53950 [Nostoc sp. MS1]